MGDPPLRPGRGSRCDDHYSARVRIDPELAQILDFVPPSDLTDLAAAREWIDQLVTAGSTALDERAQVREAEAPEGVRVILAEPRQRVAGPIPAVLFLHGGGFVLGSAETELAGAAMLAAELGAVVASVDYRLAPEHPFPAALDDCMAALRWLAASDQELGIDAARVAVVGNSAGGGLAAAVALRARDEGGPALCFQFLGIPELDDRLDTPSMRAYTDTPLWNRPSAVLSWRYYLGDPTHAVSPYAAPARADDLTGLPPAYVSVAQFDPLRDEGIDYAQRLAQAGTPVELHLFPGTFHGSALMISAAVSRRQVDEMVAVLARALA